MSTTDAADAVAGLVGAGGLRERFSFTVGTPPGPDAALRTTVYVDGDITTKVFGEAPTEEAIDAHFTAVRAAGAGLVLRLKLVGVAVWFAYGAVFLGLWALPGRSVGSFVLLALGGGLSVVVDRSRALWSAGSGRPAVVKIGTPLVLAGVAWLVQQPTLMSSLLLVALANGVNVAIWSLARWRIHRALAQLGSHS